jgi:predicted SprT family Zn-dependent metalloprotease
MQLKITYSFENDLQRIIDTINQIDWFKEKGYRVELPPELDIAKIKEYSVQEVSDLLKQSWRDEKYKNVEKQIEENWQKYSERFEKDLIGINLKPAEEYKVVLTRYGVGGSFNPQENKITLNTSYYERNPNRSLMVAILHEIVHINIAEYIQQNKIPHEVKEKIVDMIMKKFFEDDFPQEEFWQKWLYNKSISENSEIVFNKFYPDVKLAIQELSKQIIFDTKQKTV